MASSFLFNSARARAYSLINRKRSGLPLLDWYFLRISLARLSSTAVPINSVRKMRASVWLFWKKVLA